MRLTTFTDYALRLLVQAAIRPGELITIAAVSRSYGISKNHLMKITNLLAAAGILETVRGREGGMRLARPAKDINLGTIVRLTEAGSDLVECCNPASNTCVIAPVCKLKFVLFEAMDAFYQRLDRATLADLVAEPAGLVKILDRPRPKPRRR